MKLLIEWQSCGKLSLICVCIAYVVDIAAGNNCSDDMVQDETGRYAVPVVYSTDTRHMWRAPRPFGKTPIENTPALLQPGTEILIGKLPETGKALRRPAVFSYRVRPDQQPSATIQYYGTKGYEEQKNHDDEEEVVDKTDANNENREADEDENPEEINIENDDELKRDSDSSYREDSEEQYADITDEEKENISDNQPDEHEEDDTTSDSPQRNEPYETDTDEHIEPEDQKLHEFESDDNDDEIKLRHDDDSDTIEPPKKVYPTNEKVLVTHRDRFHGRKIDDTDPNEENDSDGDKLVTKEEEDANGDFHPRPRFSFKNNGQNDELERPIYEHTYLDNDDDGANPSYSNLKINRATTARPYKRPIRQPNRSLKEPEVVHPRFRHKKTVKGIAPFSYARYVDEGGALVAYERPPKTVSSKEKDRIYNFDDKVESESRDHSATVVVLQDVKSEEDSKPQGTVYEAKKAKGKKKKKKKGGKFESGGGKKHKEDHHADHGKKGDKGYKGQHKHVKSEKGHHDKEGHKGKYEDHGGHKKKHSADGGHFGKHHKGEKGKKGAKYGEHGKHEKGHSTKGEHNIHKKDEYEKKHEFFDEYHEGGESEKHGGFHTEHDGHKGGSLKLGHHQSKFDHDQHKKKGHNEKGKHFDENEGHKKAVGKDDHHHHEEKYGKKEEHHDGKKWGYKKGKE